MSDDTKDIIEKYENQTESFVATEEDLKSIVGQDVKFSKEDLSIKNHKKIEEIDKKTIITKGEFVEKGEVTIKPIEFEQHDIIEAPKTENELVTDYQYIRSNIYSITERSIEALNNLVQIADQSQHPRAYEVVGLLVNSIANAQKSLMEMHREKAKIEGIVQKNQPEVVNNNLFVGNTAQLDEIISKMSKKKKKVKDVSDE